MVYSLTFLSFFSVLLDMRISVSGSTTAFHDKELTLSLDSQVCYPGSVFSAISVFYFNVVYPGVAGYFYLPGFLMIFFSK